jgi:DNA replication protein DnaC
MTLEQYLQQESDKRKFPWNDMSQWTPEKVRTAWMRTGESLVKDYRDLHPELTDDLIYYILRDKRYSKDLDKGIAFLGVSGTGKTVQMKILTLLIGFFHNKRPRPVMYSAKQMERILRLPSTHEDVVKLWIDLANESGFVFDDMGKESERVKSMGTDIEIGIEVIEARYLEFINKGSLLFVTSNDNLTILERKHGIHIVGRMKESMNIYPVKGEDQRI